MPNTPPQLVQTAAGPGWTNPTKITGTSGQAFRSLNPNTFSPALAGTNCGFAIPLGSTIAGVLVSAVAQAEIDFELGFSTIQLVGVAGTPKSDSPTWITTPTQFSYGGPTDLWGAALTPTIINSASFGFQTIVHNFSFADQNVASVNAYTVAVYYSFGSGSVSNGGIPSPLNMLLIPAQVGNQYSFYTLDPTNFNDPNSGGFYNWKVEDVIAGRTPTVSRVIISYRDLGPATFTLVLTGTNDAGQVVAVQTPVSVGTQVASRKIVSKVLGLALTAQNIQPSVIRAANSGPLSITKLRLEGRVETTVLA